MSSRKNLPGNSAPNASTTSAKFDLLRLDNGGLILFYRNITSRLKLKAAPGVFVIDKPENGSAADATSPKPE